MQGWAVLACLAPALVAAQEATPPAPAGAGATEPAVSVQTLTEVAPRNEWFTLRYYNRPVVLLRARLLGRTPQERALAAVARIDQEVAKYPDGPVEWRLVGGLAAVTIGGEAAVELLPADADALGGTLEGTAREAALNLGRALAEAAEARSPVLLVQGGLRALAATVGTLAFAAVFFWLRRHAIRRIATALRQGVLDPLQRRTRSDFWRAIEASLVAFGLILGRLAMIALGFLVASIWLSYVLRQFPFTRPWGEALSGFMRTTIRELAEGMLAAIPGLVTVALVIVLTRLAVRVANGLIEAVEQGRLTLPGVFPETAQPTRRLVAGLLWIFAVVVAYPYLPGSGSDAFKGVSVFVGLVLSLGSSGLVNQIMSGFMLTYARVLRVGEFVRIGDVEGSVVYSGPLVLKILTRRNEEVTLPNAVAAGSTITNYSRLATAGVFARTSVTIGYDTPWRQVQALLLDAASRTPGVRAEPPPSVVRAGLSDFAVEHALLVALERPEERVRVLSDLHGHILDVFNEQGVQIMTPHYEGDPDAAKVVPRDRWFTPPAKAPSEGTK
jgi:small-conductance mechanosensitive channel